MFRTHGPTGCAFRENRGIVDSADEYNAREMTSDDACSMQRVNRRCASFPNALLFFRRVCRGFPCWFGGFSAGTSPARSFRSFIIQGAGISGFGEINADAPFPRGILRSRKLYSRGCFVNARGTRPAREWRVNHDEVHTRAEFEARRLSFGGLRKASVTRQK